MAEVAAEREGKRFGGWWFEGKGRRRLEGFAVEAWVPPIPTGSNTISCVATAISTLHPSRVNTHPVIYLRFLSPATNTSRIYSFFFIYIKYKKIYIFYFTIIELEYKINIYFVFCHLLFIEFFIKIISQKKLNNNNHVIFYLLNNIITSLKK